MVFLQEKEVEATKQEKEKREDPKPEEEEGTPQHQHCPPAKRREDRSPKYQEEQHKGVACILAAHPPKTWKRNIRRSTSETLNADIIKVRTQTKQSLM
jgi:hypothetical protein